MKLMKCFLMAMLPALLISCGKMSGKGIGLVPYGEYKGTIRYNETENHITVTFCRNGDFYLLYDDPSSPICGLKESVIGGVYKSEFEGITPKTEECSEPMALLNKGLLLLSDLAVKTKKDKIELDGATCTQYQKRKEDLTAEIIKDTKTDSPVLIRIRENYASLALKLSGN